MIHRGPEIATLLEKALPGDGKRAGAGAKVRPRLEAAKPWLP